MHDEWRFDGAWMYAPCRDGIQRVVLGGLRRLSRIRINATTALSGESASRRHKNTSGPSATTPAFGQLAIDSQDPSCPDREEERAGPDVLPSQEHPAGRRARDADVAADSGDGEVDPRDRRVLTIAVVEPSWTDYHVAYRVGARHPLDQGAAGRAILLGRALADGAAEPGDRFVQTVGELQPGARGLASPVLGIDGLEASVGIVTLGDLDASAAGPRVSAAADEVARRLS